MRTAEELMRGDRVLCRACRRNDHRYCTMSVHCECDDVEDGEATRDEFEAYYDWLDKESADG